MLDSEGTKLYDLIWVCIWRDRKTGRICRHYIHHIAQQNEIEHASLEYFADALLLHLEKDTGLFNGIQKVYFSGDHAKNFANFVAHALTSIIRTRFGLEIVFEYLCSYHAYNECDGCGAIVCSCLDGEIAAGRHIIGVKDFKDLILSRPAQFPNHDVYIINFLSENYDKYLGALGIQTPKLNFPVQKYCEVIYIYIYVI